MSHLVHLLVTTIGPIHGPAHALPVVLSISPAHHLSYPPMIQPVGPCPQTAYMSCSQIALLAKQVYPCVLALTS